VGINAGISAALGRATGLCINEVLGMNKGGKMNKPMHEDKLYKIAYACVEMAEEGCHGLCAQCHYNIYNYVDDLKEATLLKSVVTYDYYKRKQELEDLFEPSKPSISTIITNILVGIFYAVLLGGFIWCARGCCKFFLGW